MKGKKEGGEIKGREGRKRGKGGKERGKKRRERAGGGKKGVPQQGSNPRPSTLQPTAYGYCLEGRFARMYYTCIIAIFDFDDLTACGCAR